MLPALFMNSLRQCLVGGGELVYAGSAGAIFHHLRSDRRFNPPGGACSSIWLEPAAHNRLVGGSSPSGPTIFVLSVPATEGARSIPDMGSEPVEVAHYVTRFLFQIRRAISTQA